MGESLDGFIARPNGSFDFLPDDPEPHGFEEFFATVDALLMGRKTYDVVRGFDKWFYGTKPVFVLSSQPLAPHPSGAIVERLTGDPAAVFAELGRRGMKHIYVDGGYTVHQFLRAGLIDRITITSVPVIIGTGISIFGPVERDIRLRHVATRTWPSGLVQSEYDVLNPAS